MKHQPRQAHFTTPPVNPRRAGQYTHEGPAMADTTATMLTTIDQLLPHLNDPRPASTLAPGGSRPTSPGPATPINLTAPAYLEDLARITTQWIHYSHDTGLCHPNDWPDNTPHWHLMWLHRHATTLDHSDDAQQWQRDINRLHHRIRTITGNPEPKPFTMPCRRCGNRLEGRTTTGQPALTAPEWRWATCPTCGQTETLTDDINHLAQPTLRTIAEWAATIGIPTNTLKIRIQRAGITHTNRDNRGRRLYHHNTINHLLTQRDNHKHPA